MNRIKERVKRKRRVAERRRFVKNHVAEMDEVTGIQTTSPMMTRDMRRRISMRIDSRRGAVSFDLYDSDMASRESFLKVLEGNGINRRAFLNFVQNRAPTVKASLRFLDGSGIL